VDKKYWDAMAEKYDDEVMSSFHDDTNRVIEKEVRRYADKKAICCDFGCGIGHYSAVLSPLFKKVESFDLSAQLIREARDRNAELTNVNYAAADLSLRRVKIPRYKFAVCANVLIAEDYSVRQAILRNIVKSAFKGAHIIFVLPSLESALFVNYMMFEWNIRDGMKPKKAIAECLDTVAPSASSLETGIVNIDGVRTKHYLKEEIISWFARNGLEVSAIKKVEYGWETEFAKPEKWMKEPYPWDWMVVAKISQKLKGIRHKSDK